MNIPIVVSAFDRKNALERLLASLRKADYQESVTLIISIDGEGPAEVVETAHAFAWPHGEKQVVHHRENLGLRGHILFCGSLAGQHDGIILLEEDLYAAPSFYRYALQAARFYRDCPDIAGIALYAPAFNENAYLPFCPLHDGHDVYFMQLACSWGQLWLNRQWREFEDWYRDHAAQDLSADRSLPHSVRQWPDTSWKKFFIKFMIDGNRYFVYPRSSLTTNFGDEGRHHTGTRLYQVPLMLGEPPEWAFVDFNRSLVKYDACGEMLPASLRRMCPQLDGYDFTVDLYGVKEAHCFTDKYVLTSKQCDACLQSYGKFLLPPEANIIEGVPGWNFFLAERESCRQPEDIRRYMYERYTDLEEQKYFYRLSDNHLLVLHNQLKGLRDEAATRKKNITELRTRLQAIRMELERRQAELDKTRHSLELALKSIDLIRNSASYRIGNSIVAPLNRLKQLKKK